MNCSPAALEVRSRRIRSGNGWTIEFTVNCPFRQRSIDLDECEQCSAYGDAAEGAGHAPGGVTCARNDPAEDEPAAVSELVRGALARTPVLRAAARSVTCVQREVTLHGLAEILVRERISGVPVVDDECRPVGMVGKTDLVRRGLELADGAGDLPAGFSAEGSVGEAMTAGASLIDEHGSLLEAAALMAERGVHRLAITGRDGRIVGLVTTLDVLRWLAREPNDRT